MEAGCAGRPASALGGCFFGVSRPESAALMAAWAEMPMGTWLARLSPLLSGQELRSLDEVSGRQLSSSASLRAAEPTWKPDVFDGKSVALAAIRFVEAKESFI